MWSRNKRSKRKASFLNSEIIKRVVVKAEEYVRRAYGEGMKCTKIAVTFPAHFDNNQRTATLLAVEKAGICKEKLTMLNEPSAAAFYYCKSNKIDKQTILVYDLGGGTFDVSISDYYSSEFCCEACYETYSMMNFDINKMVQSRELNYIEFMESNPVIYRIRNKINGKNYIGQTIRSFTLRWWEHYKSWIKKQPEGIENFDFSVLEEFTKEEIKRNPDLLKQREQYWIDKYDAIENGYNSRNEVSNVK